MIIKPKVIGGGSSPITQDSLKIRFMYLAIENGVLVNKIEERYCNVGESVTPPNISASLSAVTKHSPALTLDDWNHTVFTNLQTDLDIGAIYHPTDNKTHAFITVNVVTGLSPTLYFNKSDTSELTISWGDGTSDYTTTSSGNLNTSHTYSTAGTYEITMWISSGSGTYSFGNGTNSTVFVGGSTQAYKDTLNSIFIGNNVTNISDYSFFESKNLKFVTYTNNIITIGTSSGSSFESCTSLEVINISSSITTLYNTSFKGCNGLYAISFTNNTTTLGAACFDGCYGLERIILPNSITTISSYIFSNSGINKIVIPSTVTSFGNACFQNCTSLQEINIPSAVTIISSDSFNGCNSLINASIPSGLTTLGTYSFAVCFSLKSITIPSGVTTIGSSVFNNCYSLNSLTLKRFSAPSTITTLTSTSALSGISAQCRIYVPVGSLNVYKTATNWSTYANRMYEDTPENRALFGD